MNVVGNLDLTGGTVSFATPASPLDEPYYIFASYTSLTGTFASALSLPANYQIVYGFMGNNVALEFVPEPAGLAGMLLLGRVLLRRRR